MKRENKKAHVIWNLELVKKEVMKNQNENAFGQKEREVEVWVLSRGSRMPTMINKMACLFTSLELQLCLSDYGLIVF